MIFVNATESLGVILSQGTTTVTGSIVATLFIILLFLIVVALMFSIPLEFLAVLILPFCLGIGAFYGDFIIPITLILIYVSTIIAKNWIFR